MSPFEVFEVAFVTWGLLRTGDMAITWGNWSLRRYLQKRRHRKHPYSWIEPKIKPLVDAMNATGVMEVVVSCEGHYVRGMYPYVYFKSAINIAATLEEDIIHAYLSRKPKLHYIWRMTGDFWERHELCFRLYSPTLKENMPFRRKQVDEDLLVLAEIVKESVHAKNSPR